MIQIKLGLHSQHWFLFNWHTTGSYGMYQALWENPNHPLPTKTACHRARAQYSQDSQGWQPGQSGHFRRVLRGPRSSRSPACRSQCHTRQCTGSGMRNLYPLKSSRLPLWNRMMHTASWGAGIWKQIEWVENLKNIKLCCIEPSH